MNRQQKRAVALATALAGIFVLSTCQQFFTTSLAKPLARSSYDVSSVSVDDAVSMLDSAISDGDAEMASALVTPLYSAASAATPGTDAYNVAASALVSAVVLSSGVGPAITSMASLFIANDEVDETFMESALEEIATVSLNDSERDALLLIAASPPEGMTSTDAYSVALALVADAFAVQQTNMADFATLSVEETDALAADPSMAAALTLLDYAGTNDPDESSLFGMLLLDFDFSGFEL